MGQIITSRIRNLDLFATPIGFTIGRKHVQVPSTLCSLIISAIVLGFMVIMVLENIKQVQKAEATTTTSTPTCPNRRQLTQSSTSGSPFDGGNTRSITTDFAVGSSLTYVEHEVVDSALTQAPIYPFQHGFNVALCPNKPANTEYAMIMGLTLVNSESVAINPTSCSTTLFPEEVREELSKIDLSECICLNNPQDIELKGNLHRSDCSMFGLVSMGMNCTSNCDAQAEYMNGLAYTIYYTNGYYIPNSNPSHGFKLAEHTIYESFDSKEIYLFVKEHIVKAIDGREEVFYTASIQSQSSFKYTNNILFAYYITRDNAIYSAPKQVYIQEYLKPTFTPLSARNLNSSSTTQIKEETKKMAIYYRILYIMATAGGLCATLFLIFGLVFTPIMNGLRNVNTMNEINQENNFAFDSYQQIQKDKEEALKIMKRAIIQEVIQKQSRLEESKELLEEHKLEGQHEFQYQKSHAMAQPIDPNNAHHDLKTPNQRNFQQEDRLQNPKIPVKLNSNKKSEIEMVHFAQKEVSLPLGDSQSSRDSALSELEEKEGQYTARDMWAHLFSCLRPRHKGDEPDGHKKIPFSENLRMMREETDIAKFLSTMFSLERKSNFLEENINSAFAKLKPKAEANSQNNSGKRLEEEKKQSHLFSEAEILKKSKSIHQAEVG
ncbi:unnamed protein product [Moneuplotes crassus]|uniref:Transmembrane protein n=1 Tax=Euplotes crassus TaxID=5936 RepID=A0AAD1UHT0_EUPCR|nr:unnamed protein product [Moneuplotes crassus]